MNTENILEFINQNKSDDMEVLLNRDNSTIFVWVKNLACVQIEQPEFKMWLYPEQAGACSIITFKETIACYQQAVDLAEKLEKYISDDQRLG